MEERIDITEFGNNQKTILYIREDGSTYETLEPFTREKIEEEITWLLNLGQ